MRIQHMLTIVGLSAVLSVPAHAQSIKKVADETHHALQKTGKDIKEGAKDAGSATHRTLQKAGNATKTEAGEVTGIHKVGGDVGKAAQSVSRTGKKVARNAKHGVKHGKAKIHKSLTKAGKDAKAEVKQP